MNLADLKCNLSPGFFGTHGHSRAAPVKAPVLVDSITDSMLFDYRKIRQISASSHFLLIWSWFSTHPRIPVQICHIQLRYRQCFFPSSSMSIPVARFSPQKMMRTSVKSPLLLACWRSFCSSSCFSFLGICQSWDGQILGLKRFSEEVDK